jgi:hypothetical protein
MEERMRVKRKRHPISRRKAVVAIGATMGGLLLARRSLANGNDDAGADPFGQWVFWDDGWAYPIWGFSEDGQWIVKFDDGFYLVNPAMWAWDSGVWYPIAQASDNGTGLMVYYSTDEAFDWELEHELEYEPIGDDQIPV